MTPQDTMRLALEALEESDDYLADCDIPQDRKIRVVIDAAIEALRSALAQQGEQQPVAWANMKDDGTAALLSISQHPEDRANWANPVPLYAGAAPAAQSLSIEEVEQINAQWNYELHGDRTRYIARMVEMKHGIGVQK